MSRGDQISLFIWCSIAILAIVGVVVAIGRDVWRYTALMNEAEDQEEDEWSS